MFWELAVADFRMRDQGTFLGFIWTLLHPLVYFTVLYNIFNKWMGAHIENFPLYLIIGIIQWNFFSSATSNTISAIPNYRNFVQNISFPKDVLVVSSVLTVIFSHLLELIVLFVFWFLLGRSIGIAAFILIPVIALNVYLVTAVGYVLAPVGVFFLDINRIWGILVSIGLFLTPVFYTIELLSPSRRMIVLLNPMTHVITATRDVMIYNEIPEIQGLLYVFMVSTVILIIGKMLFRKYEGIFPEKI